MQCYAVLEADLIVLENYPTLCIMYRHQNIIVGIDIPQLLSVLLVCLFLLVPLPHN